MKTIEPKKQTSGRILIQKCQSCGHLIESFKEAERCPNCSKSFLPINYFGKVHAKNTTEFEALFASSDELHDSDLIKGIHVLW